MRMRRALAFAARAKALTPLPERTHGESSTTCGRHTNSSKFCRRCDWRAAGAAAALAPHLSVTTGRQHAARRHH